MKALMKIKMIVAALFIVVAVAGFAQDFTGAAKGLKAGNATELAKYFDGNVEVTILNKEATYSKTQAEMVLKNFFNANSPSGYTAIHNGDSGSGSKYQIGELTTTSGVYRTYVYGKVKDGKFLIQEIRIEEN